MEYLIWRILIFWRVTSPLCFFSPESSGEILGLHKCRFTVILETILGDEYTGGGGGKQEVRNWTNIFPIRKIKY